MNSKSLSLFFKNKSFLSINFSTFPITFFTWNVFLLSQLSRSLAMHLQFKVNSKSLFFKNKSFLSINFSTFPITFFTWNVFLLSQLSRSLATHLQFKANSKPPADYRHEYPPLKRKKKKRKIPGYGAKSGRILTAKKRNWGKGNWLAFELTVTTVNELVPTAEFRLSISRIANPVSRVIGSEARLSAAPPFGRKSVRTAERLGTGVERVTVPNRHRTAIISPPPSSIPPSQYPNGIFHFLGFSSPDSTLPPTVYERRSYPRPPTCPSHSSFSLLRNRGIWEKIAAFFEKTPPLKREYYSTIFPVFSV